MTTKIKVIYGEVAAASSQLKYKLKTQSETAKDGQDAVYSGLHNNTDGSTNGEIINLIKTTKLKVMSTSVAYDKVAAFIAIASIEMEAKEKAIADVFEASIIETQATTRSHGGASDRVMSAT